LLELKYSKIDAKLADMCRMADSKRSELGGTQGSVFDDPDAIRMFSVRCIWEPAFCLGYDRLIVHCHVLVAQANNKHSARHFAWHFSM